MTYLNSLIERATINLFSRSVTEKKKEKLGPTIPNFKHEFTYSCPYEL